MPEQSPHATFGKCQVYRIGDRVFRLAGGSAEDREKALAWIRQFAPEFRVE